MNERDSIVVDVAGASMGGARRWLSEFDKHAAANGEMCRVTGRDRPLSLQTVIRREAIVVRARPRRVVATNNLSFVAPGVAERVVLVRNALHFLDQRETADFGAMTHRPWERQAAVIRRLLRRATLVVVPSTGMADRVRRHVPSLAEQIVVRFHPVSPQLRTRQSLATQEVFRFLCPVLDAPFKRLNQAMRPVLEALDIVASRAGNDQFHLELTMSVNNARQIAENRRWLVPLGRLTVGELDVRRQAADALVYPTTIESFGYPLAEARAEGRWVLAPASLHNTEIAGPALVPYADDPEQLSITIERILADRRHPPEPDPSPFFPGAYFSWLLGDGLNS